MVFVSICFHRCESAHTHIRTHKTMLRRDPPISSPSFRKPQNQTRASLFQLPFFPAPSPHHIHLNSPTVFLGFFFSPLSLLVSNVSMCYHHKHSVTHHNLVIIISTLKHKKTQFMAHDLLNRLQLIANNSRNI